MTFVVSKSLRYIFCLAAFTLCASAQSSDQFFPTPIYSNEISGSIVPRRIGDNRQTRYFYTFNVSQGDLFVNVVTQNFNGDIDIFIADTMQPVGKMVIYADTSRNETGRLIYFRKPEKILLRIEGRTPNDTPATYLIKFAGSFLASNESGNDAVDVPTVKRPIVVTKDPSAAATKAADNEKPTGETSDASASASILAQRPADIAAETAAKPKRGPTPPKRAPSVSAKPRTEEKATARTVPKEPDTVTPKARPKDGPATIFGPKKAEESGVDPFAGVIMRIELRDGTVMENRMSDVQSFVFDRGQLSVRMKDGKTFRYALADVAKFSIQ